MYEVQTTIGMKYKQWIFSESSKTMILGDELLTYIQGRVHSDLFNQEKRILNCVDLMVKLHRHKPEFCLLSADTAPAYKITIEEAIFYIKKIKLTPSVSNAINDSYNGKYKKNPFNFQHYNLTQIGISVNGEEVPFKPLKLNFDDKLFVTA